MPFTTIQESGTKVIGSTTLVFPQTLHPKVAAFINLQSANSVSLTNTQVNALNNLYIGLVANGLDTKMNALYPFIGGSATAHKFNLMDARDADAAFRLNFVGGWTHDSNGSTPNGTTGYANTFLTPSISLSVSSGHFSFYSRVQALLATNVDMGASSTAVAADIVSLVIGRNTNSSSCAWGTQAVNTIATLSSSSSQGFFVGNQNGATAAARSVFRNGIASATATVYGSPAMSSTSTITIGALNTGTGGINFFSSRQCSLASIGSGLSNTEVNIFSVLVQAYETALGRNV